MSTAKDDEVDNVITRNVDFAVHQTWNVAIEAASTAGKMKARELGVGCFELIADAILALKHPTQEQPQPYDGESTRCHEYGVPPAPDADEAAIWQSRQAFNALSHSAQADDPIDRQTACWARDEGYALIDALTAAHRERVSLTEQLAAVETKCALYMNNEVHERNRADTAHRERDEMREPTEAMLNAARDWSTKKYGVGIGNDAAIGCWQAMYDARISTPPATEGGG